MCSSCKIKIFVLSLLCGWGQMNQGIYWGHRAFCAWVSAWVFSPIPQLLTESSHYCTHKQGHLSKSVNPAILSTLTNDQRCCFLARTVFALKGTCTVPSLLFFFYLVLQPICLYPLPLKEKKIIQLSWCGEISLLRSTASVCAGLSCTSNKILCRLQT